MTFDSSMHITDGNQPGFRMAQGWSVEESFWLVWLLQDAPRCNPGQSIMGNPSPTYLPPLDAISRPTSHPPLMPYMVPFNPEDVLQNKQIDAPHIPEVF